MPQYRFDINPVSASRPRVSRYGHAYFSGPYKAFREVCDTDKWQFVEGVEPSAAPLKVDVECYVKRPKTTKLQYPKPDVDNYAKAILDQMNEVLWEDDKQIIDLSISKSWSEAGEEGYFTVNVEEIL